MSKTGIKELAQTLTEKYGLDKAAAEKFVEQMFSILAQGLETERMVKVKGLGTFKVVGVASRKSVDVNTGEPIIIEGRDKVSFTPDAAMRDRVNKPFAQFETVVVNDGVDFSAIDEKYSEEEKEEQEEATGEKEEAATEKEEVTTEEKASTEEKSTEVKKEEPTTEEIKEEQPEPVKEVPAEEPKEVPADAPKDVPEKAEEPSAPIIQPETKLPEQNHTIMENNPSTSTPEHEEQTDVASSTPSTGAEPPVPPTPPKEPQPPYPDDEDGYMDDEDISYNEELDKQRSFTRWALGIMAALLLACVCGIFLLFSQLSQRDRRIEHLEAEAILRSQTPQGKAIMEASVDSEAIRKAKADSIEAAQQLKAIESAQTEEQEKLQQQKKLAEQHQKAALKKEADEAKQKAAKEKAAKEKAAQQAAAQQAAIAKAAAAKAAAAKAAQRAKKATAQAKPAAPAVPSQAAYNKDARVRTGAYNIIGVETTVTVRPGQTLASISRSHLGPGMECYVEAVNGGKTTLKAGDKVKIPKLALKKKGMR